MATVKFAHVLRIAMQTWGVLLMLAAMPAVSLAQEDEPENIKDNSFLVEEAYNQEAGVVQHISNWIPAWEHGAEAQRTFDYLFTQEWPVFSQQHQFSYIIPMRQIDGTPDQGIGTDAVGFGDILLNYRLQALYGENPEFPLAFAPRVSLILPAGDVEKGLGNGKPGYQINLPFSLEMKKWGYHFNAGMTKTPGVVAGLDPDVAFIGHTMDGYNLNGSVIRLLQPNFHLMLESVFLWDEELQHDGHEKPTFQAIVSPGFRWAPYTKGDTQWVLGLGLPIGLSADSPDIGIIFYMSFEHRFMQTEW